MTVLMVMRIQADAAAFERVASEHADDMRGVAERARAGGAIHHAFYAGDGEILLVDEWDKAESFQAFFEAESATIGPMMQEAGMSPAEPQFYEKLDTADVF